MSRLRPLLSIITITLACALAPSAAQAAGYDPNGLRFTSDNFTVHENGGQAVITITRSDTSQPATAYYVAVGIGHQCGNANCNATPPQNGDVPEDFGPTNGALAFQRGQGTLSFTVPIVDHHFDTIPKTFQVAIFNAWNQGIANPSKAVVTIINDDPTPPRDPSNPLMLPVAPTGGDPLTGARFFVDHDAEPAVAAHQFPAINVIASQPGTARFGAFSGSDVGLMVNRFLVRASVQEPGTVPMMATYRIVDGHCGHYTPTAGDVGSYHNFISRFAQGIGSYPAVLYLEMDSLITSPCLSAQGLQVRLNELHDAINILTANCPHLVIYLDAGAADAIPAAQTARLLNRAGISQIEGFFLNSTHFDWTSNEIRFGQQVSALTGGKRFVVNTGDNGRGPLVPADRVHQGNEVLCNPAARGLGPKPTATTGFPLVDAFAWTTNPGESGGACVPGAPPTGAYWPAYALMLIRNADFAVDHHATSGSAARAHHKRRKRTAHKKVRHSTHHVVKHKQRNHRRRRHTTRIFAHMA